MRSSAMICLAGAAALFLFVTGRAPAIYFELRSPGVALPKECPAAARDQIMTALARAGLTFIDGHALNSETLLRYRSDTAALNRLLDDLAKCPGVTLQVQFAKIEDDCDFQVNHSARTNYFNVAVNLNSRRIRLQDLALPEVKGPEAKK